ncbi:cAMP-regulated phosphoprotein 21-like isoform X2 [Limulus polyphemus]|uniref:cAMP-regulated phosphoprotein 21-like isoform X2 n=1 Tax=Limulus polyphemus TaxID=6850 RepID=A0ABM1SAL7_LIMPO|nr:cAMP-regulated phosphoprotein 21-like isoform X2 [Limulus polyphemus]
MEKRPGARTPRLAKQEEIELEEDEGCINPVPVTIHIEDRGGGKEDQEDNSDGGGEDEGDDGIGSDGDVSSRTHSSPGPGSRQSPVSGYMGKEKKAQSRAHHRVKLLVRSQALRDDTSPPPDAEALSANSNMLTVTNASTLTTQSKGSGITQQNLGKHGSSQGSMDSCSSLSRDSSTETYTDSTGIDLQQFIIDTLHKNQKDRMMLLRIEQDVITLIKDNKRQSHKFPQMSSYHRMLVHRVAAFFGLDHNVDQNGTAVIVNKTKNTRLPEAKFRDHIRDELMPLEPKKSILKRDSASFEEGKESPERQSSFDSKKSKSFEEREEEYEKEDIGEGLQSSSQEDIRWTCEPRPWSSTDSDSSGRPNQQGIKVGGSFESEGNNQCSIKTPNISLLKSESETKDMICSVKEVKPAVTKASSFGGISVLTRDCPVDKKSSSRLLKSESVNVPVTSKSAFPSQVNLTLPYVTVQTSTSPTNQISSHLTWTNPNGPSDSMVPYPSQPTMWAIPSVDHLPLGSVIINPQLGTPYINPDGSMYRLNSASLPGSQHMTVTPSNISNQHGPSHPSSTLSHVQQQVTVFSPSPAFVYIPYIPQQMHQPPPSAGQVIPDHRPLNMSQDFGAIKIQDLTAQMSNLSFAHFRPPSQMHVSEPGPANPLGGNPGIDAPPPTSLGLQNYLVQASKLPNPINLHNQQQQLQAPLYFVQQPSGASVKYVCASPSMIPSGPQQTLSPGIESMGNAHQPFGEVMGHQTTGSLIPGQHFVGHYPGFNITCNNAGVGGTPNFTSRHGGSSTVTITTASSCPSATHPCHIYPYGSMLVTSMPSGTTTQASQSPEFMTPLPVPSPVGTMPFCMVTPNGSATPVSQSPLPQFSGGGGFPQFSNFRPQTPPSQNGSHGTPVPSVPLMGYTVLSPQSQIHPPTPTGLTPNSSNLSSCAGFASSFLSTFASFRPGFPVGRSARNNTPPPQGVFPLQYPSSQPNFGKGLSNTLNSKSVETGCREQSEQNLGSVRHDGNLVNKTVPFHQEMVSRSSVYRKGAPLVQGLPLHHQVNPLMFQSAHPIVRFPHVASSHTSTVSRQPKVHRQRSRGGNVSSNRSVGSSDNPQSVIDNGSSQFLEVEGLPDGMKRYDIERYLEPVTALGAKIEFVCNDSSKSRPLGNDNITKTKYRVLAIFESNTAAQTALLKIKTSKFQLRPPPQQREKRSSFKTLS